MEAELNHNDDEEIPREYLCPITQEIMTDPLMSRWGVNFERRAILTWIEQGRTTCPLTRKPLLKSGLIPNAALRQRIKSWSVVNGFTDARDYGKRKPASEELEDETEQILFFTKINDTCDGVDTQSGRRSRQWMRMNLSAMKNRGSILQFRSR